MSILEFLKQPWPWYVGGPMIALVMFLLLWTGRRFGISSSLETACTIAGGGRLWSYFRVDWKESAWLLIFIAGSMIGGFLTFRFFQNPDPIALNPETIADLETIGIQYEGAYVPSQIFNWSSLGTLPGFIIMVIGGLLIGFGTRYAGGCTSGHSISGISELQTVSLVATIGFFIGGLIMTHFLLPLII
jgi:uncharacterized membrane protein YedE/YeeE